MSSAPELGTDRVLVHYQAVDPTRNGIDEAAADLARLRACRDALNAWEGVLTDYLADALGRNAVDIDDVGRVEVKRSTDRKKWDRRDLLRSVLDSHRPPSDDGEMHGSDMGEAMIDDDLVTCSPDLARVLDVWNLGAPRVTALRERGIDPDEYCESTPGRVSVVIT